MLSRGKPEGTFLQVWNQRKRWSWLETILRCCVCVCLCSPVRIWGKVRGQIWHLVHSLPQFVRHLKLVDLASLPGGQLQGSSWFYHPSPEHTGEAVICDFFYGSDEDWTQVLIPVGQALSTKESSPQNNHSWSSCIHFQSATTPGCKHPSKHRNVTVHTRGLLHTWNTWIQEKEAKQQIIRSHASK